MLDEYKEFQEYTLDSAEMKDITRLKSKPFTKSGSITGLRRALTIIARYYIFNEFKELAVGDIVKKTKEILGNWLGDPVYVAGKSEENEKLSRWLERYVYHAFVEDGLCELYKQEKSGDKLRQITEWMPLDEKIDALKSGYPVNNKDVKRAIKMFEKIQDVYKGKKDSIYKDNMRNDLNKYTYDTIIADAFNEGPLACYYLVGTGSALKGLMKKTDKRISEIKKTNQNELDRVLKLTAAVLLNAGNTDDVSERFIQITWADIGNWTVSQSESDDFCKYYYKTKNGKSEPLFERKNIGAGETDKNSTGNMVTIKMNSDWMKDYGWKLIPVAEFVHEAKTPMMVYSDGGAKAYLKAGETS